MKNEGVYRDERTITIENAAYRWSYLVVSFGLLLSVAIRSLERGEASWDLLSLIVLGGLVNVVYQAAHRTLNKRWAIVSVVTMIAAMVFAALAVGFLR